MNKKILCIGDSFTYGDELRDPNSQSWPNLLATMNNWDVTNMGKSGASNDRSVRVLFEEIDKKYDLIILSWTIWIRFEVFNNLAQIPISLSPRSYMRYKAFWAKEFYSDWCDDVYMYRRMLTQIIQTQSYLKSINQKYIFSMTYKTYPNDTTDDFKSLVDKIDTSSFLHWPKTLNSITDGSPKGPFMHPLIEGHEKIARATNDFIHTKFPSFKTE